MRRIPYRKGSQGKFQGIAQNLVGRSSARKFEKMSSRSFYSGPRVQPARTARIVTYLEAIEAAGTDEGVENIVVLPPDNGDNRDADSDVEDILAEGGDNDGCDVGHEAAGEFELDYERDESASSEDDDLLQVVDVRPGAKCLQTARASACSISRRWRRMSSFDTVLPTGRLDEVLANHHPDLLSKWWLPGGSTATWTRSHFLTLIFVEVSPFASWKCTTPIVQNLAAGSFPTC